MLCGSEGHILSQQMWMLLVSILLTMGIGKGLWRLCMCLNMVEILFQINVIEEASVASLFPHPPSGRSDFKIPGIYCESTVYD